MTALQPGDPQRVGPYVLLGRLGSGGMGRVYLARSPGGRMVAVKVIRANLAEDTGFRARFAREVSAARKVGGLFTAQVVDADIDGAVPWLVTAYVAGTSLSDAVERQGPLPQNSVLALAAGLAEGLIAIHAAGVIHRDLKPSNVLLAQDGPRIIDFGISSAAEATQLTGTGFMIGSPGFMSPEQAEGLTVGPASDIFSLAGVLIYAARGEGPFGTGDTAALLYRVVHGKPTIDRVPDNLRPLIKRSLSRDPKRRPTATQFLADLSAAYPAAADLANWLPARILDLAPTGFGPAEGRLYPPAASGASLAGGSVAAGSVAGGSVADRYNPAMADPVAPMADPVAPMPGAADAMEAEASAGTSVDPPTRTSVSSQTPPPPTAVPAQGYPGQQGTQGNSWWSGQQTGGMPQSAPPAQGGPGLPGADQWHGPPAGPTPPRKRPRWLIPAVAAAAGIVIVVVALLLALPPGSHKTGAQQPPSPSPTGAHTPSPTASPTPTVGNLLVSQFQVGDCLTGANLNLDTTAPFPKLSLAVPCSQGHLAEVFYANNSFWAKSGSYPGEIAISNAARTQCNSAFESYVGIQEWNSIYRSLPIAPSATTWSTGERGLHCLAYYATPSQPAGVTLHGSIKGTGK